LNQILRRKVSIVSVHAQTTRNAIRGILTTDVAQIVFVDTPGLHRPKTLLSKQLNNVARATLPDVDAVTFIVDVADGIGPGDAFIAQELRDVRAPVVVAMNKVDLTDSSRLAMEEAKVSELGDWPRVPTSARLGTGISELVELLVGRLPPGPFLYPPDEVTDQPDRVLIAELLREKLLDLLSEEVPHSVAVVVEDMVEGESGLLEVDATIYVERESQKGIVIGRGGRILKEAGSRARAEIEPLLGRRVFLRQRVKVARDWQDREGMARRFGYAT